MIKNNGKLQAPQRIWVPEYPRQKINTRLFRAARNTFLLRGGLERASSFLGKKALGKKRKEAK